MSTPNRVPAAIKSSPNYTRQSSKFLSIVRILRRERQPPHAREGRRKPALPTCNSPKTENRRLPTARKPVCPHPRQPSRLLSASAAGPCLCRHTRSTACGPCRNTRGPCRRTAQQPACSCRHTGQLLRCPAGNTPAPCREPPERLLRGRPVSLCRTSAHTEHPPARQCQGPPKTIQIRLRRYRCPPSHSPVC